MVRTLLITFFISVSVETLTAQVLDFSEPVRLPAAINTDAEETMPLLTSDGELLFFARVFSSLNTGGRFAGSDIWTSANVLNEWKKAESKKFNVNTKFSDAVVGMTSDGKGMIVMRTSANAKINGLYLYKKAKSGGWDKPELIAIPGIDGLGCTGFYMSPDLDVMFISMKGLDTRGEEDLYISLRSKAGWSIPKNLGQAINTTGFEISPFLSANKKRLYFSSNGYAGKGDADIYFSDRLYDTWETWSTPRNLGAPINSEKFDAYFSIYGDTVAYFSSNRGNGMADIYKSHATPGDESYNITQRYLTSRETGEILGGGVSRRISFDKNVTEVSSAQKELLYFIGSKVVRDPGISIHIVVQEEAQSELNDARQSAIYDQLRQAGVESFRLIVMTGKAKSISPTGKTVIELNLFR